MAGFSPSVQGNFYLPRSKVLPPWSLEQAVWTLVNEWLAWFDSESEDDSGEADRQDLVAQGFLHLLQRLRIIPPPGFGDHEEGIFHSPHLGPPHLHSGRLSYLREDVKLSLTEVEDPEEIQISKVLPTIAEKLSMLESLALTSRNGARKRGGDLTVCS